MEIGVRSAAGIDIRRCVLALDAVDDGLGEAEKSLKTIQMSTRLQFKRKDNKLQ